jgi:uncharacterized protein YktA (UPF0223 family)
MNSYKKLQENYPAYRSLNVSDSEEKQLTPLFDYILNGLESYGNEIQRTGTQFADFKDSIRKGKQIEILSKSREKVLKNPHTELANLQKRQGICRTAIATVMEKNISDPIERLMIQLQDQEIRGDLAGMSMADRTAVLFSTSQAGNESILRAVKNQPPTQKLIPSSDVDKAHESYTGKVAPRQVAELALMKDVVEKAKVAMSLVDVSFANIEAQAGIASQMSVKAY